MIQESIQEVMAGRNLDFDRAKAVMDEIMSGQACLLYTSIAQAPAHIGYNTRLEGVAISDPYALDLTLIHIK